MTPLQFYNESLVRHMKNTLDLKDIENYKNDLMKQNVRKVRRSFIIPVKNIEIIARIRSVFHASFRSLESYMRIFQEILGFSIISNGRDRQGKETGIHDPGGWPEVALLQHHEGEYKDVWVFMQHSNSLYIVYRQNIEICMLL